MNGLQRYKTSGEFKYLQIPTESIYNLLSRPTEIQHSSPRYQSIYANLTKEFYKSVKKPHGTMGHAKTPLKHPSDYLKKHTRETRAETETKPFVCLDKDHKKPPVPRLEDAPPVLHDEGKDFLQMNRVNVIRRPARKPARKLVDKHRGDIFFLEFSGLVSKFCMKEEFGKTPKYLVQRRKDLHYSDEVYKKSIAKSKLLKLSEEERKELLEGLRTNWNELYSRYLSLPLVIDTKSLKTRKLELEKKLDLLESDIYFLEKNEENDIYILPD